ncbi:MAG: lipid A deacylase LpxR family protein [Opitutae bacterium]|nr:lipid A deacylase LpxR family protein [Opitutae bacterium]
MSFAASWWSALTPTRFRRAKTEQRVEVNALHLGAGAPRALLAFALGLALLTVTSAASATSDARAASDPDLFWGSFAVEHGSWTLVTENDKYFAGTDRHYTNGFKFIWLGETTLHRSREFLKRVANTIPTLRGIEAQQRYKVGLALGQEIFTPTDIATPTLLPNDRPYAGWLYASMMAQAQERDGSLLRVVEVSLGVVGPSALGEAAQNGWHDVIHVPHAEGWANQLHDEPGLMLSWERRYRLYTITVGPDHILDVIGRARLTLGNVHTHLATGFMVRAGWNLPHDFGTDLIRPAGGGMANAGRARTFGAYTYLSAEGRAVARNIFLDGNTWRSSHSVSKLPFMGDVSAGFVLAWPRFQLTYTQDYRSKEFRTQQHRDVFGSIALTTYY